MKIAKIALIHLQSLAIAYLKKMYRHQLSMKFSFHLNKQGTNPTSRIGVFVCVCVCTYTNIFMSRTSHFPYFCNYLVRPGNNYNCYREIGGLIDKRMERRSTADSNDCCYSLNHFKWIVLFLFNWTENCGTINCFINGKTNVPRTFPMMDQLQSLNDSTFQLISCILCVWLRFFIDATCGRYRSYLNQCETQTFQFNRVILIDSTEIYDCQLVPIKSA